MRWIHKIIFIFFLTHSHTYNPMIYRGEEAKKIISRTLIHILVFSLRFERFALERQGERWCWIALWQRCFANKAGSRVGMNLINVRTLKLWETFSFHLTWFDCSKLLIEVSRLGVKKDSILVTNPKCSQKASQCQKSNQVYLRTVFTFPFHNTIPNPTKAATLLLPSTVI